MRLFFSTSWFVAKSMLSAFVSGIKSLWHDGPVKFLIGCTVLAAYPSHPDLDPGMLVIPSFILGVTAGVCMFYILHRKTPSEKRIPHRSAQALLTMSGASSFVTVCIVLLRIAS
jgi:hypothetical protein